MFFLWNAFNIGLVIASGISFYKHDVKFGIIYGVIGAMSILFSTLYYYKRHMTQEIRDICANNIPGDCLDCDMNKKNGFDCIDIECGKMQILEIDCDGVECMNADCCSL
ncbi:hypothetical protein [Bacillus sp. NPDC094106]|uniref:hypothetical protein n=1 Tax=Bacillus sp. NPDC094106 TaxID=3363949 RepID=UPI003826C928